MKKFVFLSATIIFIICSIVHFIYDIFPCTLTSIFAPVNESSFEHMKMIFTGVLIYSILEYFIVKKYNVNNLLFATYIKGVSSILIFLIFYIPIYYRFGENMIITFILLYISLLLSSLLSYKLFNIKELNLNVLSIILIIISYIIFGYLTYKPIKDHFFFDVSKEKYGINDYLIK